MSAVAIDITLVALPAMTRALDGDPSQSGLVVAAYLAGFAPGQLAWGLAGDRFGRRAAVLAGVVSFVLATIACALAPTFAHLLAARFLQGFAGGSGPVLSRAYVRDIATDVSAARLLALLTAILGAAPLLAPILGSALLEFVDWRAIFWFTAAYGALLHLFAVARLPEPRPARRDGPAVRLLPRTIRLVRTRDFRIGAALVALPFSGYHTLLALYPTLAIVEFGFSESTFTWLFAGAAMCFIAGSTLSRILVAPLGMANVIRAAIVACVAGATLTAAGALQPSGTWVAAGAALYMLGVGQVLPVATALAVLACTARSPQAND